MTPAEIAKVVTDLRESIAHQLKVVSGYPAWCEEARQACLLIERLDAARVEAERTVAFEQRNLAHQNEVAGQLRLRAVAAERERDALAERIAGAATETRTIYLADGPHPVGWQYLVAIVPIDTGWATVRRRG